MTKSFTTRQDLSHPARIAIDEIGPEGVALEVEADPAERAALARRFGLVSLDLPIEAGSPAEAETSSMG